MYHDEFAPRANRDRGDVGGPISGLAIEVGGGVSAAAASALAIPGIPILLELGGVFPLMASCLGMISARCREVIGSLGLGLDPRGLAGRGILVPATINRPISTLRGPRAVAGRARTVRAGFDRSRHLG